MGRNWAPHEDDLLRLLISKFGKQWSVIASHMPNRSATQIAARWEKCINPLVTKGPFTAEEDQLILDYVEEYGCHAWPKITTKLPHRTSKQCRERYFNNLDPTVTKTPWTPEEDQQIFQFYIKFGPKWSTIAHHIQGRTDNSIKNRFNASISKRITVDSNGEKILAPVKLRKYSKKNKMLEKERPEALNLQTISSSITLAEKIQPKNSGETEETSTNTSPLQIPPKKGGIDLSPFTLTTPNFADGLDPFNGQETPISPFSGFNFPTPDFSPKGGFKFNAMQSPLFSPKCGSHAFDDC